MNPQVGVTLHNAIVGLWGKYLDTSVKIEDGAKCYEHSCMFVPDKGWSFKYIHVVVIDYVMQQELEDLNHK